MTLSARIHCMKIVEKLFDSLESGARLEYPATIAKEFEDSLANVMREMPYMGDPTTNSINYHQWRDEGKNKYSVAFMALRNRTPEFFVRDVSVGDMLDEKLTTEEEKLVSSAVFEKDFPSVSKLFVSALLDLVKIGKYSDNKEKAKIVDQFLSYWGKILLIPQDQIALEELSNSMKERSS